MEFGVVLFDAFTLFQRASCRADAEPKIPQSPGKLGDQRPGFLLRPITSEQKQNVQIGVREKHLPPVTAEREQAKSLCFVAVNAQNFAENLPDVSVRQFAECFQRFPRARASFKLLPDALAFSVGLWPEHG